MSYGYLLPTGFTVEFWFNRSTIPGASSPEAIFSQQTQNTGVRWDPDPSINGRQIILYFYQGTGVLSLALHNNAGSIVGLFNDTDTSYVNDNTWHFCAVRLGDDSKTLTLWLDSTVKYSTVMSTALDWVPGTLAVGGAFAPNLGNFGNFLYTGGLAYFAAFNEPLSDSKILDHYTAGSGGTVFHGDDEVTRLGRLYDYCGVPVNARRFDDPITTLQGVQIAGQNGLSQVLGTASDASGMVYADGQSVMVYHNRRHRYNRPIAFTLTEDESSAPDVGMEFSTDDTKVYNDVRASRPYGGSARLRNKSSEYEYGQKPFTLELKITSDEEMRNAGTWVANRYGEDRVRVSSVTLSAESSDMIQDLVETIDIGDKIAFDDLPDNAPQTYGEYIVEGVSVNADFKAETWSVGLELSPAELWNVVQLGVSTLGDGSRIAF